MRFRSIDSTNLDNAGNGQSSLNTIKWLSVSVEDAILATMPKDSGHNLAPFIPNVLINSYQSSLEFEKNTLQQFDPP